MKIDWKLKGFNLLKFNCNKDQVVHPETCSDMVQMEHDGEINLTDWIKSGTGSIGENLASWIDTYIGSGITVEIPYHQYSGATSGTELGYFGETDAVAANRIYAPYGSNSVYGVFRTGYGLTANDGILNLNTASIGANGIGGIKIGYNATGTERALLLNNNGEAYVDLGTISSVPPTYVWKNNSWSIDKSENTTSGYHAYAYQTVKEYTLQQDSARVLELDDLSTPEYIHPVAITSNGILCTYVVPQTYGAYQGTANGLVPLTTASDRTSKFLNGVGNWVLFETLSSTKHDSTKSYFVKGSGSNTTKFLKGDGTWDVPTNTTYNGDGKSVFLKSSNTFYAPNQFSETTNIYGEALNSIDGYSFKKTNYNVIGIPDDVSKLILDITNIFSYIAELSDDCSFELTYSYDYDDVLQWTLDGSEDNPFILRCAEGKIECNIYGDITATPSATPIASTSKIDFETGVSSTNTHTTLTFIIVVEEGITYVDIISDNKEIQLSI